MDYGRNFVGAAEPDIVTFLRGQFSEVCLNFEQQNTPPFAIGMPVTPDGTAAHPYPICNVDQLRHVAETANLQSKNFILEADLDLTGFDQALGRVTPFTGTFDGNNHILAQYHNEQPAVNGVGFVEHLQGDGVLDGVTDGEIGNLTLLAPTIHGLADVGAVVGETLADGSLQNLHVIGGSVTADGPRVGGIAGKVASRLEDSSSSASVISTPALAVAGGLTGVVAAGAVVERSSSTGNVTATGADVGGLIGTNLGTVNRSSARGAVSGQLRVGGLVGSSSGPISDSYARGDVSGARAGGLIGQADAGSSVARSYAVGAVNAGVENGALVGFADPSATFTSTVWNTTLHGGMNAIGNQSPAPSGVIGKTTLQMQVRSTYIALGWDFLQVWGIFDLQDYPIHDLAGEFCAQVPQQAAPPFAIGIASDGSPDKPYPLCTMEQMQHVANTTSLYSKHYIVMGDIDLTGMTGTIGTSTTSFTGAFDGNGYTLRNYTRNSPNSYSALFGVVDSPGAVAIKNLMVEDFTVSGKGYVGALVGELLSGDIEDVHVVGAAISQTGTSVQHSGGLVARAHGFLRRCTSSATVSAVYLNVGGLAGTVEATGGVEDSSSAGNVIFTAGTTHSSAYAGGLVGRTFGPITDSFSYAVIQADRIVAGGLVGTCIGGSIGDSNATGAVTATGTSGGLLGRGDACTISSSWATGAVVTTEATGEAGGLIGEIESASVVEDCSSTGNASGSTTVGGLIGFCNASTVENSQASGTVVSTGQYAGGLIGRAINGSLIEDSDCSGNVTGVAHTGGLIGSTSTSTTYNNIVLCHATGNVFGDGTTAGLVGNGQNVHISRSWASGNVTTLSTAQKVGGLVGSLQNVSTVANSYARGNVAVGNSLGGGLIGAMSSSAAVSNSYAIGVVTGSGTKGALIGTRSGSTVLTASLFSTTANPGLLGVGSGSNTGASGRTDAQLKQQATYTGQGWDFTTIWMIDEGQNYAEHQ